MRVQRNKETDGLVDVERSAIASVVTLVTGHPHRRRGVVLDLGCGFGEIAESLRALDFTYIAFDSESEGLVDLARRGFETAIYDLGDTEGLSGALEAALRGRNLGAITLLDVIDRLSNAADLLRVLHSFLANHGSPPLVVSVANVTHIDLAGKLLLGRFDVAPTGAAGKTRVAIYGPQNMETAFVQAGWTLVGERDVVVEASEEHSPGDVAALRRSAPLGEFLFKLRSRAAPAATTPRFVHAYAPSLGGEAARSHEGDQIFLSVLIPVEPGELSTLEDLLLSLESQVSQDFDVTLLLGDLDDDELEACREVVAGFDLSLAKKTRLAHHPNTYHSTRLNAGVASAKGRYVAILPASDVLLFSSWVEELSRLAEDNSGAVVRTIGVEQFSSRVTWPSGRRGHVAIEAPRSDFAPRFNAVEQLLEQRYAPGTYALPMSCFSDLGLRYADELSTGEDVELFLRAALLCGVEDSTDRVTVLRRYWRKSEEASASSELPQDAAALSPVGARLDAEPLLLPAGSLRVIHGLVEKANEISKELRACERARDFFATERNLAHQRLEALSVDLTERGKSGSSPTNEQEVADKLATTLAELSALRSSRSWRLTAPLRRVTSMLRRSRGLALKPGVGSVCSSEESA